MASGDGSPVVLGFIFDLLTHFLKSIHFVFTITFQTLSLSIYLHNNNLKENGIGLMYYSH